MAGPRDDTIRRDSQRLLLHALAAAAQYSTLAGIDKSREAALEVFVHDVTQRYPRFMLLRQLGDDFDLHEKAGVDQALDLHPGSRRQPLLVVILEA